MPLWQAVSGLLLTSMSLFAIPALGQENDLSTIRAEQRQLAEQYRLLEDKLFSLYEYEKNRNPGRAQLLQEAFRLSQEKMTADQLATIVQLLDGQKLKNAEDQQQRVLAELTALLEVLQSDDQQKLLQDKLKRYQGYLKEVDRLLRIQKGIRGQTEGGADMPKLANSEREASQRAAQLADEIRKNETEQETEAQEAGGEGDPSDQDPANPAGEGSPPSQDGSAPSRDAPAQGDGGDQRSQLPRQVQAAQEKMQQAQRDLEQAKQDEAIDAMEEAERRLEDARRELEEILKQLREEEVKQTLARLEARFRDMLDQQVRVNESTRQLDRMPPNARATEFEISANRLSKRQREIAADAARALLLLEEDGSSVAFPVIVEELQQDMLQVANRLAVANINAITLQIEDAIVQSLNELIEALVQTQEDLERMQAQQQSPSGQSAPPGQKPLVDQLAELKMLRGLQQRILQRHQGYAQLLDNPDDPIGATADPEIVAALQRLADRQSQLTEITRDLVDQKNQ